MTVGAQRGRPPTFKVIGLGGVGGIVVRYLAIFLAALGRGVRLVLIDGDAFEEQNAERMLFEHCGNKASVLRDELLAAFGASRLAIEAVPRYIDAGNAADLVREGDLVILAVDNHATRKLVSEHCAGLGDVCLISGGNDGVEQDSNGRNKRGTFGNVQVYLRRDGRDTSPSLTSFHPEIAEPADALPNELSCADLLDSVPQILFTNLMTAACILNALWLHLRRELHYSELCFDVQDGLMRPSPSNPPTYE